MFRVLIVDDERLIREGLSTLIDWTAQGFEVAALAADGQQALEIIAAQPIDLVLADIRMPRLGGLELLEALRRAGNPVRFLILSGFAEFAYAQRAASGRIDGYLLKPVDEDELCARLAEVRRDLGQKPSALSLIGGNPEVPPHLKWDKWQVLLVLPLGPAGTPDLDAPTSSRLRQAASGWGEVFDQPPVVGVLLRQVYPRGYNLEALARELSAALGPHRFAAGIGDVAVRSADIPASFAQAQERLRQRFFSPPDAIAYETKTSKLPAAVLDGPALASRLALALESRSASALDAAVEAVRTAFLEAGSCEQDIKTQLTQMAPVPPSSGWLAGIWAQASLEELLDYVKRNLGEALQESPAASPQVAPRLLEIMEARYAENLKLDTLAQAFQYNSAYLGKLFRAQTGESFHAALDRIRIRRAQEFLQQGYKVYQVAELVGYRYVDYFHAKFKKHTGLTPSEYRG